VQQCVQVLRRSSRFVYLHQSVGTMGFRTMWIVSLVQVYMPRCTKMETRPAGGSASLKSLNRYEKKLPARRHTWLAYAQQHTSHSILNTKCEMSYDTIPLQLIPEYGILLPSLHLGKEFANSCHLSLGHSRQDP
jgi:hypothetical protein